LALSGHRLVRSTCLLLPRSGRAPTSTQRDIRNRQLGRIVQRCEEVLDRLLVTSELGVNDLIGAQKGMYWTSVQLDLSTAISDLEGPR
jgi:hypothetical protein